MKSPLQGGANGHRNHCNGDCKGSYGHYQSATYCALGCVAPIEIQLDRKSGFPDTSTKAQTLHF